VTSGDRGASVRQMLNKVPEVTLYFWVIKVLCTTVGETASDYLATNLVPNTPIGLLTAGDAADDSRC
jgi:uncharacterized membrane-anchored protein